MMMRGLPFWTGTTTWLIPLAVLVTLGGCNVLLGIDDTRTGDTPDAGPSDPRITFDVLTPAVALPLDGLNIVDLQIQRLDGFDGAVTIAPTAALTGVVIQDLTIPAGETTGQLVVGALAPFDIGDTVMPFDLQASGDGITTQTVTINGARITGKPGLLDVTFGPDATGYGNAGFGSDDGGEFTALEITPDDKIITVGFGLGGLGGIHFHIARFNGDGTIDNTFNNGQVVNTQFAGSTSDSARAFAVGRQVDGRIIAIGWRERGQGEPPDVALAQYASNGQLGSQTFGNHEPSLSLLDRSMLDIVHDGAVLPNNQILAVGSSDQELMIARATSNGNPDSSFGTNGFVTITPGTSQTAFAMDIDSEGRIVVAGSVDQGAGNIDMLLARFSAEGVLDSTFGTGGVVTAGDASATEEAHALALQPDGSIVIAGHSNIGGDLDFEVRRFTSGGAPDLDFGDNGVVHQPITAGIDDRAEDMALLPDGRIVVVGNITSGADRGPVLARYTSDGKLDTHFDGDGIRPLFVGDEGLARAVAVYDNNKIVIAGANQGGVPGPGTFGILVRMWQ